MELSYGNVFDEDWVATAFGNLENHWHWVALCSFLLIPGTCHPVTSWYPRGILGVQIFVFKKRRSGSTVFVETLVFFALRKRICKDQRAQEGRKEGRRASLHANSNGRKRVPKSNQARTRPAATSVRSWFSSMPIKILVTVSRGAADWGAINSSLKQQQQCQHWSLHLKIVHNRNFVKKNHHHHHQHWSLHLKIVHNRNFVKKN